MTSTVRFEVESAGNVAARARVGRHTLVFDQPQSQGGDGQGPSPLPVFAASAAACAHYYAAAFLAKRGLAVDGLRVDVEFDKADVGPARISRLALAVHVPPATPAKYLPAIERSVRGCPVWGTLSAPPELSLGILQDATGEAPCEG